ncbi:MAG: M20 family metallopeptidase [Eubacteriales bacterium]|nr:M20 family metallopeptidase [Eubacteriales bacterium]
MDRRYLDFIDSKKALLKETSDYIWENPETAFTEFKSAEKLIEVLKAEGFNVEDNLAGIKTAFKGTYGSGRPVIAFLGEFDALSGLGQKEGVCEKTPDGNPAGHGCGHNNLGVAPLASAIAVKKYLEDTGREGTIIYFGCPGEEGGSGKTFMVRDHVFDGVDIALTWHPTDKTEVRVKTSLANIQVLFKFDGIASHAGAKPEFGRSALDAVELMNVGVNYLREHTIQESRIHYAVTDTGGFSPNVVQAHAEVLYLIRAPKASQAKEIYDRIIKIAQGAALMTETEMSYEFIKAVSNTVLNDTLQTLLYKHAEEIGVPAPSEEDMAFFKELSGKTLMEKERDDAHPLHYELLPYTGEPEHSYGSTDVGDVSWVCPTAQMHGCTVAKGTQGHSWQFTVQNKTPYSAEMTRYIGKVLAATAVELFENPELIEKAKEEHKSLVGDEYVCPIPMGVRPRSLTSIAK